MNKILDCHVHVVGNGSSGSGCRLNLNSQSRKFLAKLLCLNVGLKSDSYLNDLDTLYVEKLAQFVKSSNIDGAVILANDFPYSDSGERLEEEMVFYVPNDYVLELSRAYPFFLPAISIHPARPDALDELERLVENGALMLKLLPNYHNVDCGKAEYSKFWQKVAELHIPFLAHTGGEHTLPNLTPEFQNPEILKSALDQGVTVIAAHGAAKSGLFDKHYADELAQMVGNYENLYVDNSAYNVPTRSKYYSETLRAPLIRRMIHGSDIPVSVGAIWPFARGYLDFKAYLRCRGIKENPIEKDYQIKREIGYTDEVFTRLSGLLSRLEAWKDKAARL